MKSTGRLLRIEPLGDRDDDRLVDQVQAEAAAAEALQGAGLEQPPGAGHVHRGEHDHTGPETTTSCSRPAMACCTAWTSVSLTGLATSAR